MTPVQVNSENSVGDVECMETGEGHHDE